MITQACYNMSIAKLSVLLSKDVAIGSDDDIEAMRLARLVEDYENTRINTVFEPYYIDK